MGVWYATREQVKAATDQTATARSNALVDRAIEGASRQIDKTMHRKFWPQTATRTFDWPPLVRARSWVLRLDEHELISVSELVAGGVTIPASDYFLRPDDGPPYNRIEIDLDSSSAFAAGNTHQRAVSIAGVFGGAPDETVPGGDLAEALDDSETQVDVTDSATIGVGSLLTVGTERMTVTAKNLLTTGQAGTLTGDNNAKSLAVTDGTAYHVGEVLTLDAERVIVEDVAGNNLIITRAWDGSALAAHTAATIYAPRTLTVQRAAVGTTAASHLTGADVSVQQFPGPIVDLCIGLAISRRESESAAYARTAGSGENERQVSGRQLAQLWKDADSYRRKARGWAV